MSDPKQGLCELTVEELELISGGGFAQFTVAAAGSGNSSATGSGALQTGAHFAAAAAQATGFAANNGAVAVFTSAFASA